MSKMEKTSSSTVCIQIGELESGGNGRTNPVAVASIPRSNQIVSAKFDVAAEIQEAPTAGNFFGKFFKLLFYIHLMASAVLVIFLSVRGFLTKNKTPTFRSVHYFIPLLSSVAFSALASLSCLLYALHLPASALKHSLWISPLFACLTGIHLMVQSTAGGFACGALALAVALALSLYACWIAARLPYAYEVLSVSVANVEFSAVVGKYVALAVVIAAGYSFFWSLGVGGIAAGSAKHFAAVYLLLLLLSLTWTMQMIKNMVCVAISRIAHVRLVRGAEISAQSAFRDAFNHAFGDVCIGSALTPIVAFIRGTARTMSLLSGGTDEFMFSCTGCYSDVADQLVAYANWWGFVHIGAYGKGFVKASQDTWKMFRQQRMDGLVDLDITGSFCFMCGVAGGAIAALISGSWVLAVDSTLATEATVYAFVIGYFIMRIAMAWPQSCVAAFLVAYAEDPQNPALGSAIPNRLRELGPPPC